MTKGEGIEFGRHYYENLYSTLKGNLSNAQNKSRTQLGTSISMKMFKMFEIWRSHLLPEDLKSAQMLQGPQYVSVENQNTV